MMTEVNTRISHDMMKKQINESLLSFINKNNLSDRAEFPVISFEKGMSRIAFTSELLNESMLISSLVSTKKHIENIRIHSFETGYYAFQALNHNLFNAENILDNIKIEIFSLSSSSRVEISKPGDLNQEEINLVIELFINFHRSSYDPAEQLKRLGASLIIDKGEIGWDYIAGYSDVKKKIRESILLPLKNPDVYDSIARMTRKVFENNRPRAILFTGPPGVGKTTVARLIARDSAIPLIYVPIESIMSKWYGQSSQNLAQIFDACEDMGGAIIFLDEIDSLAGSRNGQMFEATRRVLSVLLRKLDGIDSIEKTITIGATNRRDDLDHALLSRFDQIIDFPLPDPVERASIFSNYASHLSEDECSNLGKKSEGLSGRNIKDICEMTERSWARKILIKKEKAAPPLFEYYIRSLQQWMKNK